MCTSCGQALVTRKMESILLKVGAGISLAMVAFIFIFRTFFY